MKHNADQFPFLSSHHKQVFYLYEVYAVRLGTFKCTIWYIIELPCYLLISVTCE
jgi:hypothetical protein